MSSHWTDDELIARLYTGDEPEPGGHLAECPECSRRWSKLQEIRAEVTRPEEAGNQILALQRERILARLEAAPAVSGAWGRRWAPALAAAFLLAIGIYFYRPVTPPETAPPPASSAETDAQLFTDVYAMEQAVEPRAAAPMRALFEPESQEELTRQ